jgi:hypothetical protein
VKKVRVKARGLRLQHTLRRVQEGCEGGGAMVHEEVVDASGEASCEKQGEIEERTIRVVNV